MRHRRRLRVPPRAGDPAARPRGDGEDDRAPRPRPGRHLPGRPHRARRAAPPDHRPVARRLPAGPERGRHDPARLQRRDVQPRGAPPGAPGARAPLPGALRLGGRRPRLRGVGPALRGALPRVLRVRPLGQRPRRAPAGARPDRDQAALLRVVRGPPGLRLGDQGDPRAPGRPPGHGRPVDVPLPGLRVRARAGDHVPGDPEAPAGHHRPGPRRPPRDRALLGAPVRGRARRRGDPGPPGPRDPPGLRARVDDVGRPGGRVPLGRARLDGGPGLHARGHDRAAPHLHARLRRSLVQRVGVRARGRALLRDRAPRDPRPPGHARRDRADRLAPRRADDRPLGRAAVPPVPGGAAGRHRLHVGRGRATRSSSATTGSSPRRPTASTGCCRAPSGAG